MTTRYVCNECGSSDIQITAWITMNGGKLVGSDAPTDQVWCPKCDKEVEYVSKDAEPEKPVLTAFWSYDAYPYVLSGEVEKTRTVGDGTVKEYYVPRYQTWMSGSVTVIPGEEGVRQARALEELRVAHAKEQQKLLFKYKQWAVDAAPFLYNREGFRNPELQLRIKDKP